MSETATIVDQKLLDSMRDAARAADQRQERLPLKPATVIALLDELQQTTDELEEKSDELRKSKDEVDDLEEQVKLLEAEVKDLALPGGTIALEIRCAGHAIDELAAEKLEEIINRIGLDTAADILSRHV